MNDEDNDDNGRMPSSVIVKGWTVTFLPPPSSSMTADNDAPPHTNSSSMKTSMLLSISMSLNDLFGDDGGGGYGQPPAERVPTTPQPRLGIVIQRSPQPGGEMTPQIYSLPDGTTPPATARQAHTPPTPPLPRGHQPVDQPPPRNLRTRVRKFKGILKNMI